MKSEVYSKRRKISCHASQVLQVCLRDLLSFRQGVAQPRVGYVVTASASSLSDCADDVLDAAVLEYLMFPFFAVCERVPATVEVNHFF